jgi:hypothetical protein
MKHQTSERLFVIAALYAAHATSALSAATARDAPVSIAITLKLSALPPYGRATSHSLRTPSPKSRRRVQPPISALLPTEHYKKMQG